MKYIIHDIERAVCLRFNLAPSQVRSASRLPKIVRPRMIAMHLSRQVARSSYPQIGAHFGGRHHATVMSANRRIAAMARDPDGIMAADLQSCREILAWMTPSRQCIGAAVLDGRYRPEHENSGMQGCA